MRRQRSIKAVCGTLALAVGLLLTAGAPAVAATPWTLESNYALDIAGPIDGASSRAGRVLDNLDVSIDGDLEQAFGWSGALVHLTLLSNAGGQPNALAGTLQGVDNIEVVRPRAKIYEAWIERPIGPASVRVGLYDLNGEFYTTEAASLLIAPAFGVGSELAATGPNGPSIFPSTALAVRLRLQPTNDSYLQVAAINAHAGVIGDPGGVDLRLKDGALVIGEAGWTGRGKVAFGAWRYSREQPRYIGGDAGDRPAHGVYMTAETPIGDADGEGPTMSAFLRLGASDGETTPFRGGGQVGVLIEGFWAARPAAAVSAGFNRGLLSSDFRIQLAESGGRASEAESTVELTYRDEVSDRVSLQPSLQFVLDPGGDKSARSITVFILRARVRLK